MLNVLNRPLAHAGGAALSHGPLAQSARTEHNLRAALDRQRVAFDLLARSSGPLTTPERRALASAAQADATVVAASQREPEERQPVTLGLGEPFTQTVTVSAYFAQLLALPVILWQLYAVVILALSRRERRVVTPLLAIAPVLFAIGIAFGYFVVLRTRLGAPRHRPCHHAARATPDARPLRAEHHRDPPCLGNRCRHLRSAS